MKKLSKKQEDVLIILCEGDIMHDIQDGSLSLEDADKNSYYVRRDTFEILVKASLIEQKSAPALTIHRYGLTEFGKAYLKQHCAEQIQDFI